MPIITPINAPMIGPMYGMTFIKPAKKPIRMAFLIPSILKPRLTIIVMVKIWIMTPIK